MRTIYPHFHEGIQFNIDARDLELELARVYHKCAQSALALQRAVTTTTGIVRGDSNIPIEVATCMLYGELEGIIFAIDEAGRDPGDFMNAAQLLETICWRVTETDGSSDDEEDSHEFTLEELIDQFTTIFV